jgi:glutathione S-transferase
MQALILHHYDSSPFSEKVRLMLGYKQLEWTSVRVPVIMPKPDVVALTGGYRKTPFLQIDADIYCDTALIARVLEARRPAPTLYPASAPLAPLLAQWADSTLFWTVIPYTMQPAGLAHVMKDATPEAAKAFGADRATFTAGMKRLTPVDAAAHLQRYFEALDAQLADGRPYLFGSEPSIADFSVVHSVWFVRRAPPLAAVADARRHLAAWADRMLAIGHGTPARMSAADAIALAASAGTHAAAMVEHGSGFDAGQRVTVTPTDYGFDAVAGELVGLNADEVVIARHDERAGALHVHFPRTGFQVRAERTDKA